MRGGKQESKFVSLAEAVSWIAFRTHLDVAGIKERLRNDPANWGALDDAMQQFSASAGDGRLDTRGRRITDADDDDQVNAGLTNDIPANQFRDFQQFDLDRNRIQYLPKNSRRVIGTWGCPTIASAPHDATRTVAVTGWMGTVQSSYTRAFESFANTKEENRPSYAAGYEEVEVTQSDLLRQFPPPPKASNALGRPRKLDHSAVVARAKELREHDSDISIASAAISISAEFPNNSNTGKPYDSRGIERIIAPLWQSGEEE